MVARPTFGTDGMRGRANTELTPELVLALGRAFARVTHSKRCLVGRDTRLSGPMLQSALQAGLCSEGVDVVDLGVLPTPGIAWLSGDLDCPAAVISASHNPFFDNGIKLFMAGGAKLADEQENTIEAELASLLGTSGQPPDIALAGPASTTTDSPPPDLVAGSECVTQPGMEPRTHADRIGNLTLDEAGSTRYVDHLTGALAGQTLDGIKVVLDTANGATAALAPVVFRRLGADVIHLAGDPDGTNINERCGSTHPEAMTREVLAHGADAGLAFDGDGDRLIAADGNGKLVDGDETMAILAADLAARGLLARSCVVVTVMTNLGFHRAMDSLGIRVLQTDVGDRYVLEALEKEGLVLGGEQSGHVILRHLASTGDGMLTGISLLGVVARTGRSLADLAAGSMKRFPQELVSIAVPDPSALHGAHRVWAEVDQVHAELDGEGRVLVRASGTEKVVRVMAEASSAALAGEMANRLAKVVAEELGIRPDGESVEEASESSPATGGAFQAAGL
ncbi:MAG: phosphoglucosamine mutase [Actinomycetota bacterium]|nr:phosphoglucosamine mutase [Actinomycetota bacterium]